MLLEVLVPEDVWLLLPRHKVHHVATAFEEELLLQDELMFYLQAGHLGLFELQHLGPQAVLGCARRHLPRHDIGAPVAQGTDRLPVVVLCRGGEGDSGHRGLRGRDGAHRDGGAQEEGGRGTAEVIRALHLADAGVRGWGDREGGEG